MAKEKKIYDLIYCPSEVMGELKEKFPDAEFEGASDCVHTDRFTIQTDTEIDQYRIEIWRLGLAFVSLNFQLWMREFPKECKQMMKANHG